MGKKETLLEEKPAFNPNAPFEVTEPSIENKPKFNPRLPYQTADANEQFATGVGTPTQIKGYVNQDALLDILKPVDASEAEKQHIIDMARKGAPQNEVSDAILTIQGKHPKQEGVSGTKGYYLEDTGKGYKIPIPVNGADKIPDNQKIGSVWGTQDEAEDDTRLTDIGKKLFNILPKIAEGANDLNQLIYGAVTGKENDWYRRIKNTAEALEFKTNSEYDKNIGIKDTSKIHGFTDLLDLDNYDFSPTAIANSITNLGQTVLQFAVTRGAMGTAGKGANAALRAGEITKEVAEKAIQLESKAKLFSSALLVNGSEALDGVNQHGLTGKPAYSLALAAAAGVSVIDMLGGGIGEINKAFEEQTGKNLVKTLVDGAIKDVDGNVTKEVTDDLFKIAYATAETIAKKSPKKFLQTATEESGQEMSQDLLLKFSQKIHDNLVADNESKYGTELFSPKSVAETINNGLGGFIGGAQGHVLSKPLKQKKQDEDKSKTIMSALSSGNVNELKTQLIAAQKSGEITKEDLDRGLFNIEKFEEYQQATKDRPLDDDSKRKIFKLTYEKANVKEGIENLEKNNVDGINDGEIDLKKQHVKEIESRVEEIWKGAEEKAKKPEEPITSAVKNFKFKEPLIEYPERKIYKEGEDLSAEEFNQSHVEDKFHYMYDKAIDWQKKGVRALHAKLEIPNNRAAFVKVGEHTVELASTDQNKKIGGIPVNGILRDFDNKEVRLKAEELNGFKALVLYDAEGHPIRNAEGQPYTVRQTEAGVGVSKYGHQELIHPSNLEYKSEGVHPEGNLATWKTGLEGEIETPEIKEQIAESIKNPNRENTYGEKYIDFAHRTINAYKKLLSKAKDKTLLVTHSQVMKLIDQWEKQGRPEDLNELDFNEIADEKYGDEEIRQYKSNKGDIILVRHGDTTQNESVPETPNKVRTRDVPLAEQGIETAKQLGEKLKPLGISNVVTSPLPRARQTAIIIKNIIHGQGGKETKTKPTTVKPTGGNVADETKATKTVRKESVEKETKQDKEVAEKVSKLKEERTKELTDAEANPNITPSDRTNLIKNINERFDENIKNVTNLAHGKEENTTKREKFETRNTESVLSEGDKSSEGKKGERIYVGNTKAKGLRKIKSPLHLKALATEVFTPFDLALQYFIRKGNVSSETIRDLYKGSVDEILDNALGKAESLTDEKIEDIVTKDKAFDDFVDNGEDIFTSDEPIDFQKPKSITETPEFKKWFDESKVIDKKGQPLVVYHGTSENFDEFIPKGKFGFPEAVYFTDNLKIAQSYSGGALYKTYLSIQNPYEIDAKGKDYNEFYTNFLSSVDYASRNGFDGVIVKNFIDDFTQNGNNKKGTVYLVFNANQIKSVNNKGEFSTENNNIYLQKTKSDEVKNIESELANAEAELKTSKNAYEKKKTDLGKRLVEDQEDLFGERKSTEAMGMFDERASASAATETLKPLKARWDKAQSEVIRLTNKLKEAEERGDAQTYLFDQKRSEQFEQSKLEAVTKITTLLKSRNPKLKIVYDNNLKAAGAAQGNAIKINPFYAGTDTPIHEVAHILIDSIGGLDNKVIAKAVSELKGTKLWSEIEVRYPELSPEGLAKEVLAEAIGREGANIFDNEAAKSKFKTLLDYIFHRIKSLFGLERNNIKGLAKRVIAGDVYNNSKKTFGVQTQKPPFEFLSKEQIDKLSYDDLRDYDSKLFNLLNEYVKEYEKNNPFDESSLPTGSDNKKRRKEIRDRYHDNKYEYANNKTENQFRYVRDKNNEMYKNIPNSEKYKEEISFLNEAKKSAISNKHKTEIQFAIDGIQNGKDFLGNSVYEIIKYDLRKLWYTGAKQYVVNIIKKLGGKKYHKSENSVVGSVYYDLPNGDNVRISDHELPDTEQRRHNRSLGIGGDWIDIIVDNPQSFSDLKETVLHQLSEYIGTTGTAKNYIEDTNILKDKILELNNSEDEIYLQKTKEEKPQSKYRDNTDKIVKEINDAKELDKFSTDQLIDIYNRFITDKEYKSKKELKEAGKRIAYVLFRNRKEELNKEFGDKFVENEANKSDLGWKDIRFKVLSHMTEKFPELQELSKIYDEATFNMQTERHQKKTKLEKLGTAVIKEKNKELGIIGKLQNYFSNDNAKYFNYLDKYGKLLTLSEAKDKGLSNAQIEYLKYFRELVAERKELEANEDVYNKELEILKTNKDFREAFNSESVVSAVNTYLGKGFGIHDVRISYGNPNTGKTEIASLGEIEKQFEEYGKKSRFKQASAILQMIKYNFKARKQYAKGVNADENINPLDTFKTGNYQINPKGELTSKFDRAPEGDNYSKDFYRAALEFVDDTTHIKHMGKILPIVNAIDYLNREGYGEHINKPNVVEWLNDWRKLHILKEKLTTNPYLDQALKTLRYFTSAISFMFNVPAAGMNLAMGVYNNWRSETTKQSFIGHKRLFGDLGKHKKQAEYGFGLLNPYAIDILRKYHVVSYDFDSNPKMFAGKLFDMLAYGATRFGEYDIQGSLFLGLMSPEDYNSFEYNDKGELAVKKGIDEKALAKKLLSYQNRVSDIQGKYADKDKRNIQRGELGKTVFQFKTWMPDYWKERFGEEYITRDNKVHKGSWRVLVGDARKDLIKDIKAKGVKAIWNNKEAMTNLKGAMFVAFLMVLKYQDDDDKDKRRKALSLDNALGNVLFIFDPNQLKFMLQQPVASIGTLTKFANILGDVMNLDAVNSKKLQKDVVKVLPYRKVITGTQELIGE